MSLEDRDKIHPKTLPGKSQLSPEKLSVERCLVDLLPWRRWGSPAWCCVWSSWRRAQAPAPRIQCTWRPGRWARGKIVWGVGPGGLKWSKFTWSIDSTRQKRTWIDMTCSVLKHQIHQIHLLSTSIDPSRTWIFPGFDQHQFFITIHVWHIQFLKPTKKPHPSTMVPLLTCPPAQGTRLEVLHVMAVHLEKNSRNGWLVKTKIPMAGW